MSDLCNTYNIQDHPTELSFNLVTGTTGCNFNIEDNTEDYNPPFSYGFYAETQSDPTDQFQYKRSWGYFINVIYWNKYNKYTGKAEQTKIQSSLSDLIYEDGALDLISKNYGFNRDGYYTIYRIFVLKKDKLEDMKTLYTGSQVIVYDETDSKLQFGVWDDAYNVVYSDVTDINDVVLQFENQSSNERITGTQSKKDIVSICYLTKCYEGLNILIVEQLANPCLNGASQFTGNSGKSLFGFNSVNCQALYNNANMQKRDYLFMLITALRQLVDRCEFVHAEKMIEEVIGTSNNAKCSQFTYLCGDTLASNEIQSGCGCG